MASVLVPVTVIAVLILLNAVFVAAEFALVGSQQVTVARFARDGVPAAAALNAILQDPVRQDRWVATAQLGITVASLGLGMYGEHVLAEWLLRALAALGAGAWGAAHTLATILSVAILTYLHIVLGEMIPKTLALIAPERTALRLRLPMRAVQLALLPLVAGLNGVGAAVLRLFGVDRAAPGRGLSSKELQHIVEESHQAGAIGLEAAEVMHELFEFSELNAGQAMTPRVRVIGVPAGASPDELRARLLESRHTRYPVFDGDLDHVTGLVHIKDLLVLLLSGQALSVDVVREVPFVPESMRLDDVLQTMRREETQLVIVMDEHGGTAGLLTLEDLFEEVIGEIDEGPEAPAVIETVSARELRVLGVARLDEVGEVLGVHLEHEDVETVSGLVLALLERPPEPGDVVEHAGVRFVVLEARHHGVERCRVVSPPKSSAPGDRRG